MTKRIIRALSSPRLAWWLLVVLLGCLLVSFLVPQRPVVGEAIYSEWVSEVGFLGAVAHTLGLDSVFSSPLFLLAMALLLVNLSLCTWRRVSGRRRRQIRRSDAPAHAVTVEPSPGLTVDDLTVFNSSLWTAHHPAPDFHVWERGEWGWRGSILMHVGLVVLLLAGAVSGLTRFSGQVLLTEGQTITDNRDSYMSISRMPALGNAFSSRSLTLRKLGVSYQGSTIVDVVAAMSSGPNGSVRDARVNQPFHVGGKSYLLLRSGHAVALKATKGGKTLVDAVVNLGGVSARGNTDSISLGEGIDVTMTVVPDGHTGASRARQPLLLTHPVVEFDTGGTTQPVRLRPGQSAEVGPVRLEVRDVVYWTEFLVRSDKGLPIAYVAFAMILLGICVRWIDPDVRVMLSVSKDENSAQVWHQSRLSQGAAERATDELVAALTRKQQQEVA